MGKLGAPLRGTLILGVAGIAGQTLGFLQLLYFLAAFGSNETTDAYVIAMTVPWFVSTLFNQPLGNIFIPVFTSFREQQSENEAWRFTSALLIAIFLLLAGITACVHFGAGSIVRLLAPNMHESGLALAESLLEVLSIYILVSGMCGLPRALFMSYQSFVWPALLWLVPSTSIIVAIFTLQDSIGIFAPAVGIITGAVIRLSVLLSFLNLRQRRLKFHFLMWHDGIREFFSLLIQRFVILATTSINVAVDRGFASGLGSAYITALYYAEMIHAAPMGLLRASFGGAVLPVLSREVARDDMGSVSARLQSYVGVVTFTTAPVAVLLIVLSGPIVFTVFSRGAMDSEGSRLVVIALTCYSIGMIPQAINSVIGAGYLALKDVRVPLIISVLAVFLNIVLDYILMRQYGLAGLALASSAVICIRMFLLGIALIRRIGVVKMKPIIISLAKTLSAATSMGVTVYFLARYFSLYQKIDESSLRTLPVLLLICALGGIVFLIVAFLLRSTELRALTSKLRGIVKRKIG